MSDIEVLTRWYAVMLIVSALLHTFVAFRCAWAVYRNHLKREVRIVILGTLALTATAGGEAWLRAWGRVQQWVCGIVPTQANPELALVALIVADIGLLVWVVAMELTTHLGLVPPTTPHRRAEDPK